MSVLPRTPSLNLYRQLECILSGKIAEDRALEDTCSKKYWNCVPQESSCMEVGTPLSETNFVLSRENDAKISGSLWFRQYSSLAFDHRPCREQKGQALEFES